MTVGEEKTNFPWKVGRRLGKSESDERLLPNRAKGDTFANAIPRRFRVKMVENCRRERKSEMKGFANGREVQIASTEKSTPLPRRIRFPLTGLPCQRLDNAEEYT